MIGKLVIIIFIVTCIYSFADNVDNIEKPVENVKSESMNNEEDNKIKDDNNNRVVKSIKWESPKYPLIARKNGWCGDVKLKLLVDKNSNVINVEIIKSSGREILDKSAKKAVENWKIEITENGEKVEGYTVAEIKFEMHDSK